MNPEKRFLELIASTRRDLMPSLVSVREEDDLSLALVMMLQVLERRPGLSIKELASHINRSQSRTSRLLARLVDRGLAERVEDPADRRQRRVRISDAGAAYVSRLDEIRVEAQMRLWNHLTEEEREALLNFWELIAKAARRINDDTDRTD